MSQIGWSVHEGEIEKMLVPLETSLVGSHIPTLSRTTLSANHFRHIEAKPTGRRTVWIGGGIIAVSALSGAVCSSYWLVYRQGRGWHVTLRKGGRRG